MERKIKQRKRKVRSGDTFTIHTYIHTYIYTYIHTYIHKYHILSICTHTYIFIHIHAYISYTI